MCCPGEGAELTAAAEASQSSPPPFKIKSLVNFKINRFFSRVQVRNRFSSLLGKSQWKKNNMALTPFLSIFQGQTFAGKKRSGEDSSSPESTRFFFSNVCWKCSKVLNPFFFHSGDTNPQCAFILFFPNSPRVTEYPAKEDHLLVSTLCAKKRNHSLVKLGKSRKRVRKSGKNTHDWELALKMCENVDATIEIHVKSKESGLRLGKDGGCCMEWLSQWFLLYCLCEWRKRLLV